MSDNKTCFIIMAIGDQFDSSGSVLVKKEKLREDYDLIIKEAIKKAYHNVDVIRADDVHNPGTMSTDIMMRIMKSDFVIADISYPNPNVFYELGLRHACKAGTLIIKNKEVVTNTPFDISHLRHIEYTTDVKGLNKLTTDIKNGLACFFNEKQDTDNHFLETAKIIEFEYPKYKKDSIREEDVFFNMLQNKEMMQLFLKEKNGEAVSQEEIFSALMKDPDSAKAFLKGMAQKGSISF